MIQNKALCFFCSPYDEKIHSKIEKAIIINEYKPGSVWGFRLFERRKNHLLSSYIERQTYTERVTDPFGNITEIERTEYVQIDFQLSISSPQILIFKPPRNYRKLLNQLAQSTDYEIAIENRSVDMIEWLARLNEIQINGIITKAKIDDIKYDSKTVGKLFISGKNDLRESIAEILYDTPFNIKNLKLELDWERDVPYVELFSNGRVNFPKAVDIDIFTDFYLTFSMLVK